MLEKVIRSALGNAQDPEQNPGRTVNVNQLFVTEAGGQITDCQGNPMPIGNSSILATNGTLHEPMLEIVRPLDPKMNG